MQPRRGARGIAAAFSGAPGEDSLDDLTRGKLPGDSPEDRLRELLRSGSLSAALAHLPEPERWHAVSALLFAALQVGFADFASQRRLFDVGEGLGCHIVPIHFYSPVPHLAQLPDAAFAAPFAIPFDAGRQIDFLRETLATAGELDDIPASGEPGQLHWGNPTFCPGDLILYYCMIRRFQPRRVVEIGSGQSTLAARRAAPGRLECIEPFPQPWLAAAATKVIASPVQQVPLEEFASLQPNDILFIDSTHVVNVGSDVVYEFLRILPVLQPGVIVHFHDIFLPFEMPRHWVRDLLIFWNEQYLLGAFLAHNRDWEVLVAHHFLERTANPAWAALYPAHVAPGGSSFWLRKLR